MTENQLESAAITYCREMGLNPWEDVLGEGTAGDLKIRTIQLVPQYVTVIPEIRRAVALQKALEVGWATPDGGPDVE